MSKAKKKLRVKKLICLLSVVLFFLFIWFFLSYNVNPVLRKISEQKVRELATIAINDASQEVINSNAADYDKIIEITQNSNGEIELMQVNSLFINLISRQIASKSQSNISSIGMQGIDVPIGTLSGLTFLTGHGPNIKIKVFPVGAISIKLDSEFISAGINQTKHRISLIVDTNVSVIMPGTNRTVSTQTEIALCEVILIGKVPDVYLNSNSLTEMINLIP